MVICMDYREFSSFLSTLSGCELVAISSNLSNDEIDTLGNFFSALGSNLSTIATANGFKKNGNINNNRAKLFHLLISCIVFEHLCTFFSPSLNCILLQNLKRQNYFCLFIL